VYIQAWAVFPLLAYITKQLQLTSTMPYILGQNVPPSAQSIASYTVIIDGILVVPSTQTCKRAMNCQTDFQFGGVSVVSLPVVLTSTDPSIVILFEITSVDNPSGQQWGVLLDEVTLTLA
jgi:hypothetical protein